MTTDQLPLTREAILTMPAGRVMDLHVAVMMIGEYGQDALAFLDDKEMMEYVSTYTPDGDLRGWPAYSTDIASAWRALEKVHVGFEIMTCIDLTRFRVKVWTKNSRVVDGIRLPSAAVIAATAPLAICRALLLTTLEAPCGMN